MSKPSGKYYLIEFDEDEGRTVAIVPYNWLKRKQNQCWWPNGKSNISWVVNCKDPDGTGNFFPFSRILDANGKLVFYTFFQLTLSERCPDCLISFHTNTERGRECVCACIVGDFCYFL